MSRVKSFLSHMPHLKALLISQLHHNEEVKSSAREASACKQLPHFFRRFVTVLADAELPNNRWPLK